AHDALVAARPRRDAVRAVHPLRGHGGRVHLGLRVLGGGAARGHPRRCPGLEGHHVRAGGRHRDDDQDGGRDTVMDTPVAGTRPGHRPDQPDELAAEWDAWRERVRATYEAVEYTCAHRLADATLAGPVAVQVVAGLIARPQVFRYFGLPYSGRIAKLAEARLAEAAAGELATVCGWADLSARLDAVPREHRDALVVT